MPPEIESDHTEDETYEPQFNAFYHPGSTPWSVETNSGAGSHAEHEIEQELESLSEQSFGYQLPHEIGSNPEEIVATNPLIALDAFGLHFIDDLSQIDQETLTPILGSSPNQSDEEENGRFCCVC